MVHTKHQGSLVPAPKCLVRGRAGYKQYSGARMPLALQRGSWPIGTTRALIFVLQKDRDRNRNGGWQTGALTPRGAGPEQLESAVEIETLRCEGAGEGEEIGRHSRTPHIGFE